MFPCFHQSDHEIIIGDIGSMTASFEWCVEVNSSWFVMVIGQWISCRWCWFGRRLNRLLLPVLPAPRLICDSSLWAMSGTLAPLAALSTVPLVVTRRWMNSLSRGGSARCYHRRRQRHRGCSPEGSNQIDNRASTDSLIGSTGIVSLNRRCQLLRL